MVVDRQYDVGQTVAASFQAPTLFTIAQDLTKMQVQADVDQSDIGRVAVGQTVRFTVDAYPEEEFRGAISQIRLNATANQAVITYPVIIEVPNPGEKLRPKMTANVTIEVATVKDVLRVPAAALRFKPAAGAGGGRGPSGASAGGGRGAERGGRAGAATGERGQGAVGRMVNEAAGGGAKRQEQTVYVVVGNTPPKPVAIRAGISDGRHSQVVSGEVKAGDLVAVGMVTAKADGNAANAPRMGGGGRF